MKLLVPSVALAMLASTVSAQRQLVLPDYQYLCGSATQLGNTGSPLWWRSGGGRFQILYDASHFTGNAGVNAGITIKKIMFRGEDGAPNLGTQWWAGVTVELGQTSLAALGPTFATNRLGATTVMGPLSTHAVTVLPSVGSTPNNYNIEIDLAAALASFPYNPLHPTKPNLLIDISMPFAATLPPNAGNVMAMQDAIGLPAVVRGSGVTSANPSALAGTVANPPVVGIEFSGNTGGYAPPIPARNEFYGAACGGEPLSFYQSFLNGQPFDLGGGSLTLTPDLPPTSGRPNYYKISKTAVPFVPTTTLISTADDEVPVVPVIPWSFLYPGGPLAGTNAIKPCTNGYIWLDLNMTAADFTPTVGKFLGAGANTSRLAPCWYDFHCGRNLPTHPLSGLYMDVAGFAGTRTCAITWLDVGVYDSETTGSGHAVHHMQVQIHEATGVVDFIYGPGASMPQFCSNESNVDPSNPAIVGFSVGSFNGPLSMDPQSRDLSHECPFNTYPELSGNIGLSASATSDTGGIAYSGRMFENQLLTWNVNNVPTGAIFGIWVLGLSDIKPGIPLNSLLPPTQPECLLSVWPDVTLLTMPVFGSGTDSMGSYLTIPHGWEGIDIYVQYLSLCGPPAVFPYYSSNALKHTVGLD